MPTTITKTIGTASRDYSTVQAWHDAAPASLVTADEIWRGECYNDSQFGNNFTCTGITTDSTHYFQLTAASGQSFQDNASVRTNALRYNQSNGVGMAVFAQYNVAFRFQENYFQVSRLQLYQTGNGGATEFPIHGLVKDCVVRNDGSGALGTSGNGDFAFYNDLFYTTHATSGGLVLGTGYGGSHTLVGCDIIRTSNNSASGIGINLAASNNAPTIKSCAVFGFTTAISTGTSATASNNATDAATIFGTSSQTSVTYSSGTPFTNSGTSTTDFSAVASTPLAANGFKDATNAPNDITGTTRAATPTIGVWELASVVTDNQDWFGSVAIPRQRTNINVMY